MTKAWVFVVQRVLAVVVVLHGLTILLFDMYREYPSLVIERQKSGTAGMVKYFVEERSIILYYMIYIAIAVIGFFIPSWFTFLLNDILNINTILRNIVKSVWRPKSSMILTLILFIVVMYAFASIGFAYFTKAYTNSMPDQVPCKNIF